MLHMFPSLIPTMSLPLQHDANPNAADMESKSTALHMAAAGGHLDCLNLLLDTGEAAGGNLDCLNLLLDTGEAAGGHLDCLNLLLDTGEAAGGAPGLPQPAAGYG